ncbi:helix-turn-helix transcriptional regulator [uncultured Rhodospira sp.]|uniref:helix-turn-helix domain-containing protein n=1 Tax=uncultured Rhodospira sp. TaxID=1936189 RepID=UPI00263735EA|nr:helix-turn-helix transcriptional regulator [uncultured Rhodospira sp.]
MNSEMDTDAGFRARLGDLVGKTPPFQWAKGAGVPTSTWNRAWNEGGIPKAPHLVRIAQYAGVTVDWLLTGEGPMRRDQVAAESPPEPEPEPARQTVAERVRILRGTMLLERFAADVGLKVVEIQALEAGASEDRRHLEAIATAIGVRLDWLLTGAGPAHIRAAPESPSAPSGATTAGATDADLLGLCLEGLQRVYRELNARIDDRSAGRLAARLHDDVLAACQGNADAQRAALNMGLAQLRRDVLASPTTAEHGKHSA